MPGDTAYTRTLNRAIKTLGGAERLALLLGTSTAQVEAWAAGHAQPPPGAILKAIDIVSHAGVRAGRAAKS